MGHEFNDAVGMEIAQRVADGLADHPEWIDQARGNLDRWSTHNSNAPSLLRYYAEWRTLLDLPIADIRAILTARNDEGQRLRQTSPFVGMFSPSTIWDIKRRLRHDQRAT